ncbi:hypothetical protein VSR01_15320 [Actinacidiphila sp. DG2A-62]|uniref:hypothetical protein n=1 Tax=Actinacidiphila sp. DG2A-62 TaxID=3108821 RepID=UPI002DBD0590|nr:hypothetical protein [Actinacidiphila sp. DG2A-62]MEC3994819.1 hypothetical protein [Actinacidiphila sp. DG2A-62]
MYDLDRNPPVLKSPGFEDRRGRGLLLVEALSENWGYTYPAPGTGKLVWARLAVPSLARLELPALAVSA